MRQGMKGVKSCRTGKAWRFQPHVDIRRRKLLGVSWSSRHRPSPATLQELQSGPRTQPPMTRCKMKLDLATSPFATPPFPTFGFRIKSPHLLAVLSPSTSVVAAEPSTAGTRAAPIMAPTHAPCGAPRRAPRTCNDLAPATNAPKKQHV